jgi:2-octaprenyl-6-methoxyphenol hydroxylase
MKLNPWSAVRVTEMNNVSDFDVVIVGGGLVGASLACALASQPLRVAVVESFPLGSDSQPGFDERTLALSYGSRQIFEGLGLWSEIVLSDATPIRHIHVSDQGYPGITHLDSEAEGVDALGYVVPSRVLGGVLAEALPGVANLTLFSPATLTQFSRDDQQATLTINHNNTQQTLTTRLLVGADGIQSAVRDLADIGSRQVDYGQTAVVTNIATERFHDYTAYERFTAHGPLAVLPASNNKDDIGYRSAVVWTVDSKQTEHILALDDEHFMQSLAEEFGQRLGSILRVGKRQAFPLSLRHARDHVQPRLALIGNAAHTLHPIAGQGFNLGLRDVAALAEVIKKATDAQDDPGSLLTLNAYARWRRRDHLRVIAFTDSMVRLFSNRFPPLVLARNLGLLAADILPPVKHGLTRRAMGLAGKLPRLARGLKI